VIKKTIIFIFIFCFTLSFNVTNAEETNSDTIDTEETSSNEITVSNIIIQGNQRVSNNTILSYAEVNQGDVVNKNIIREVIKKLYDTGYFEDISVEMKFNDLIIKVTEKPIISDIKITDNSIIGEDDIFNALDNVGISRTRPYDKNVFDKIEQELVRLYFDRGRYNASIQTKLTKLERNRVAVELIINEGEPSRIKKINFIGNKNFSNEKLKGIMTLGTKYFFQVWSDKDTYSSSVLKADIGRIEDYYFNRGYIRFRILSNQVHLSNDNQDIVITINMEEGEKYEFGDLRLFGNTVLEPSIIKKELSYVILPKQTFSRQKIQRTEKLLASLLGEKGYAFPDIVSLPIIDDETKIVDLEFRMDVGQATTVRRINIKGNDSTNDEVYRRELRQYESSLHVYSKIERSKVRLQRLKFVDNVEITKTKVPNSPDLVDLTFVITERKAGEFKISAGWSDTDGAIFDVDLKQDNFLGGGNNIAIKASKSSVQTALQFYLTDPYYTPDGVAKTINLIISETDVTGVSTATYLSDTFGGGVMYNAPTSETESFGIGYDILLKQYTTTIASPIIVTHHIADHGDDSLGVDIKANYTSDTRNRTRFAETGILNRVSGNLFLAAEGASYVSARYNTEFNIPYNLKTFGFDWNTVFQLRTQLGVGAGLSGATSLPFYNKFFAGGNSTVRGFKAASLGPLTYNAPRGDQTCAALQVPGEFIKCDAVGGDFLTVAQFDWLFPPPPFLGDDARNFRTSLFVDAGNVFEKINNFDYNEIRASYGLQVNISTPVGALSVGFANALKDELGDDFQSVIFRLGGTF